MKKIEESKISWTSTDIGKACIDANANLVVVYHGKKLFWSFEDLVYLAEKYGKPLTLAAFCECVEISGEHCKNKKVGDHFAFVARNISCAQALNEAEEEH